ncbi:MAG: sigma-70 family RNA polymerase sigma factor [Marmoricola sp.]
MDQTARAQGLRALRHAVAEALASLQPPGPPLAPATASGPAFAGPSAGAPPAQGRLFMAKHAGSGTTTAGHRGTRRFGDEDLAVSSAEDKLEGSRIIALVDLARNGDKDAFGQLYDHYHLSVFRFLYYRVSSSTLAEDLTAETFFRALRSMSSFRWQGKDFGAWLMTIARNLAADHYKAGRTRLESTTEDMQTLDTTTEGPESDVLTSLTNEALVGALGDLPNEQRDCLVMRFLEGLSIAETADILGRSAGAVKQLQLRGVRNLAKLLPEEAFT